MPDYRTQTLTDRLRAVCPIVGVSIGTWADRTTWRVDYKLGATDTQRNAAQTILAVFNPSTEDVRSPLAQLLDTAINAIPAIDPRIKVVFVEWRKQIT